MVKCEAEQPLVANYVGQVVLARPAGGRSLARKKGEIFGKKTFVIKYPKRENKGKFAKGATRGAKLAIARVRAGAP